MIFLSLKCISQQHARGLIKINKGNNVILKVQLESKTKLLNHWGFKSWCQIKFSPKYFSSGSTAQHFKLSQLIQHLSNSDWNIITWHDVKHIGVPFNSWTDIWHKCSSRKVRLLESFMSICYLKIFSNLSEWRAAKFHVWRSFRGYPRKFGVLFG